jgi:hypothetical protein
MASSILSSAISKISFSMVSESTGRPAITNIKIESVRVKFTSQNLSHKMETGLYEIDSRIILPGTIEVSCICPDIDTLDQLAAILKDNTELYSVYSKGLVFNNVMVDGEGVSQTSEMLTSSPIKIRLKQVLIPIVSRPSPAQTSDSSVIDRGFASLSYTANRVEGLFSSSYKYASTALSGI